MYNIHIYVYIYICIYTYIYIYIYILLTVSLQSNATIITFWSRVAYNAWQYTYIHYTRTPREEETLDSNDYDHQKFCSFLVPTTDPHVDWDQQNPPKIWMLEIIFIQSSSVRRCMDECYNVNVTRIILATHGGDLT